MSGTQRKDKPFIRHFPWESDSLSACALSPDGIMIGFDAGRYYLFNANDCSCKIVELKTPSISGGIFLDSKRFLGCCTHSGREGETIITLDVTNNTIRELCATKGTRLFEKISNSEVLIDYEGYKVNKLVLG